MSISKSKKKLLLENLCVLCLYYILGYFVTYRKSMSLNLRGFRGLLTIRKIAKLF